MGTPKAKIAKQQFFSLLKIHSSQNCRFLIVAFGSKQTLGILLGLVLL